MAEKTLTDLEEHQIAILYHVKKMTVTQLANKFSVHRRTIDRAIARRSKAEEEESTNAA